MNQVINTFITGLNDLGQGFWDYAAGVFIQASLLIILLLILDFLLQKRVRAVFRYCLWMLLFIKLVLPASFTLPTGIGYWLGDYFPSEDSITKFMPQMEDAVPMMQMEKAVPMVLDIPQGYVLEIPTMNETAPAGIELESISWQGFVFLGWVVGMIVLSVSVIRRFYYVRRLITNSRPANERSLEMLDECCSRMGIRRNIELRLTSGKLSPAVCGFFKPVILMPAALLQKLSREKLRTVLIHELAHIKRCDAWVNLLQTILQIVYFYNPLIWLANAMIRRAREQAVDEMVLVALRPETKNYSNMLIDIAEMKFWRPNFSLRIIGVVESKKALERRINHMLTRPVPKSSKLGCFGLIAIVVIGAILLPMGRNSMAEAGESNKTIIPGVRVGDYTFDMSKDEVLKRLGEPEDIFLGGEKYTLSNLPGKYYMSFGDISFEIDGDLVKGIGVHSPLYKFTNGLGVGDSEQKIKETFGNDFHIREFEHRDFLRFEDKGLHFEISKKDRTIIEIGIRRTMSEHGDSEVSVQQERSKYGIVPGVRVGDYTLDMSKDDILKQLGEPEAICLDEDGDEVVRRGQEKYDLNNRECLMIYSDISFGIEEDSVEVILVRNPLYILSNGLKVGDSEQKVKQTFGENFKLEEALGKVFRCYHAKGLAFEIHNNTQTIAQIVVYKPEGDRSDRDVSEQQSGQVIVPGVGMGDYTLDMNKDDILRRLGKPNNIHFGGEDYTLDNLPKRYFMFYDGISFFFNEEVIAGISTNRPRYQFANGLKVGDSQDRIVQTFGEDFRLKELNRMDVLIYETRGLRFEIDKRTKTIEEISVNQVERNITDSPKELKTLPKYDPDSDNPFQIDLRGRDLLKFDLINSIDDLLYASFDDRTIWPIPDRMPSGFDWQKIMEQGKNPGLGVRSLHEKGITGRGVRIAILDQPLLIDHQEYAERVRLYEEIDLQGRTDPAMHGAAVASIAVGNTVGVAPEAELYYIAKYNFDRKGTITMRYIAQGINRIVEINEQLPKDNKIRVISISRGWGPSNDGYDDVKTACEEAKTAGVFVASCSLERVYGFQFHGLGRQPLANPDIFESYEPGLWWAKGFYDSARMRGSDRLLIPMDSRTTASPAGSDEYVFYRQGGWSWSVPYIAGVYALAAQVEPDITPERFWSLAMQTGRTIELDYDGKKISFGPIIEPVALITALQTK